VDSLVDIAYNVVLYAFLLWVLLFALQLSDLFASLLDMRGARDIRTARRGARRRVTEYFWSIPVLFTLVLGFALGIDYAGRLLFDDAFRAQLEQIDSKQRRIRLGVRDRAALPRTRAQLRDLADSFRAVHPSAPEVLSAIGWPFAWAYLWRGNLLRVVAPLLALLALVIAIVATVLDPHSAGWLAPLGLGAAFVVSSLLALLSARASLASKVAWHAIYLKQRTEVEDLLLELEKASRKGVAGLGDRVTRALQILREQQE
jgi:hypothetical protein